MSIVGPRPELEEHTRCYDEEQKLILDVRPGITDYASLKFINLGDVLGEGNVDDVYVEQVRPEKNALRLKYVRERTFWGDLKLIFLTFSRILRQ